jgi:hypothetical protein
VVIHYKGTQKVKRIGSSKAAAELVAAKVQVALPDGRPAFPDPVPAAPIGAAVPISFKEAADRWLATYPALAGLRQSTVEGYRVLTLHVHPRLGARPFTSISREDIRTLIAELVVGGKSRDLIKQVIAPIRATFNEAIEADLQLPNPAARIGRVLRDRGDPPAPRRHPQRGRGGAAAGGDAAALPAALSHLHRGRDPASESASPRSFRPRPGCAPPPMPRSWGCWP